MMIASMPSSSTNNNQQKTAEMSKIREDLTAKRKILESQMLRLISEKSKNDEDTAVDDDGYEVIKVSVDNDEGDEHHYLTPRRSISNLRRKSNSDTNLLMAMHEIEVAINGDKFDEHTFNINSEPEQGFYRVYDDLDRVREWDLIPYVIERKKREAELAAKQQAQEMKTKQDIGDVKTGKTTTSHRESRISLDSGRASIVSSGLSSNNVKRNAEDSGSNCSNDSGTYNLFDVDPSQQHHNQYQIKPKIKRRPPPPPPPISLAEADSFSTNDDPPPLPPRTRSSSNPVIKRKDLTSFFGLLEDEPNELLSKEVVNTVALQNLELTKPQEDEFSTIINEARRELAKTSSNNSSPSGKKDLKKFLGIANETKASSTTFTSPSSLGSISFKKFGSSPVLSQMKIGEKCRRELKFQSDDMVKNFTANDASEQNLKTPLQLNTSPTSQKKQLNVNKSVQTSLSPPSKIVRRSSSRSRRRSVFRTPTKSICKSALSQTKDGLSETPLRSTLGGTCRRSLLASLRASGKKKKKKIELVGGNNDRENVPVDEFNTAFAESVESAKRQGLPVVPFMASKSNNDCFCPKSQTTNNNIVVAKNSAAIAKKDPCYGKEAGIPPVFDIKSAMSPATSYYQRKQSEPPKQPSSLYLPMNSPSLTVKALATTPGRFQSLTHEAGKVHEVGLPGVVPNLSQPHCKSCTCSSGMRASSTEFEYVRMVGKHGVARQLRLAPTGCVDRRREEGGGPMSMHF